MISWLVHIFLRPEFFGALAVLCGVGYVYFSLPSLNPLNKIFRPICEVLGIVFLVLTAYAWAENKGYARGHAELVAYQAEIQAQVEERKRLDALAASDALALAAENKEKRDAAKKALKAKVLPPSVGGVAIPAAAVGLLNDAVASANTTGTPGKPETAAAPDTSADVTLQALSAWAVEVLDIHGECRDRVSEWEKWYGSLRGL